MKRLKNNVAIFVLKMCVKQVEHYTNVINSCETLEQLNAASGWILGGFKKMDAVAGNLNGARRKLCDRGDKVSRPRSKPLERSVSFP